MTPTATQTLPWGTEGSFLFATWSARRDTPAEIAARVQRFLAACARLVDDAVWLTTRNDVWQASGHDREDLVRAAVVRDDLGYPEPESGYSLMITATGPRLRVQAQFTAGAVSDGRRGPSNAITVEVFEVQPGSFTGDVADVIMQAVIDSWDPLVVALRDEETLMTAHRGGWLIPIGYRTWISGSVGRVEDVAPGIAAREVAGGSHLAAPDTWDPDDVVDGMLKTFASNGLDKIPHPHGH